jgi:hypothetical protein
MSDIEWGLFCKWASIDIKDRTYGYVCDIVNYRNINEDITEYTMAPIAVFVDKLWPRILDDEEAYNDGIMDEAFLHRWAPNTDKSHLWLKGAIIHRSATQGYEDCWLAEIRGL